jgi:hypothetical protein
MVLPVILPAQITTLARRWRDDCLAQWGKWTHPLRHLVGDAVVVSPEDGQDRKVALYLSTQLPAAAFTCLPDAKDKVGVQIAQPGYYSIHIERTGTYTPSELLAILLHEMTHVVDPAFVSDTMSKKHWPPAWLGDAHRHYALASEQRAFTAMWMEELRDYLTSGVTPDLNDFLRRVMGISWEFRGFYNHNLHLAGQIADHFNQMAAYINAGN